MNKYTNDTGQKTQGTEDLTSEAEWVAADETVAKVDKGNIKAIGGGDTHVRVSYKNADIEKTAGVDVYVNACPNSLTDSTVYTPENSFVRKASAAGCSVCGKRVASSRCELINGYPDASFIFILARVNDGTACAYPSDWSYAMNWESVAKEFSKGLNYVPGPIRTKFGLYLSDKIFPITSAGAVISECDKSVSFSEEVQRFMVGFVQHTSYPDDEYDTAYFAPEEDQVVYCSSEALPAEVFAHEQIGHQFGGLDDEYENEAQAIFSPIITLNCTADPRGEKWKSFGGDSYKGCYTRKERLYRSSFDSLMRDHLLAKYFSAVQTAIITSVAEHWPDTTYTYPGRINLHEQIYLEL